MNDPVVLIPGGAGNLGRTVTAAFLEQGARVAVPLYKTDAADALDSVLTTHRDRLFTFFLDLTTERGAAEAVREVVEWGGRLDAVVHLVGGYTGGRLVAETVIEAWDRMMDLNLKSAWLVAKYALPAMVESGGGSLVFVSSSVARGAKRGHAAYAVAKAGLLTLTEAIAEEYGERGVRANAVMPTTLDTEANRRLMPDADRAGWTAPEELARLILALSTGTAGASNGEALSLPSR